MISASADLVLHNARIYTVDETEPTATALATSGGDIHAVGSSADLLSAFPSARQIDAGGCTVVPGFIDAHAHLMALGHTLLRVDLRKISSPAAVVERLKTFVATQELPEGAWLRGYGWDQTEWSPSRFPTREPLDDAFPNRPVWLTRTDGHAGWANTAALEATVGLDRLQGLENPEGGTICRDAGGRPTGLFIDRAMDLIEEELPAPSERTCDRALTKALHHTARHGLTGLHDAGTDAQTLRRFQRFLDDERFPLRVYAMIDGRGDLFDRICTRGPMASERLQVQSVKFFADGALGSRGAALLEDYADAPGTRGLLLQSPDEFQADVQAAIECGLQVNTHAIGDRANRLVLEAYESAQKEVEQPLRRPRIEHAQIVHPDDLARFGRLGVIASVQPLHATSDMDWVPDRLGPERLDRAYAWASLSSAGARLAFGSDAPVEPIDPLRGFHAAVTRTNDHGDPEGGWHPSERVSRSTALHAYTQGAAYAAFQEDFVGSLTPGKRADFVVLSQNIMEIKPSHLLDTEVVATYLDGRAIYTRKDWPDA